MDATDSRLADEHGNGEHADGYVPECADCVVMQHEAEHYSTERRSADCPLCPERLTVETPCLCGPDCSSRDLTTVEVEAVGPDLSDISDGYRQYRVTVEPDEIWAVSRVVLARSARDAAADVAAGVLR